LGTVPIGYRPARLCFGGPRGVLTALSSKRDEGAPPLLAPRSGDEVRHLWGQSPSVPRLRRESVAAGRGDAGTGELGGGHDHGAGTEAAGDQGGRENPRFEGGSARKRGQTPARSSKETGHASRVEGVPSAPPATPTGTRRRPQPRDRALGRAPWAAGARHQGALSGTTLSRERIGERLLRSRSHRRRPHHPGRRRSLPVDGNRRGSSCIVFSLRPAPQAAAWRPR
jgi:hypothetical protein